MLKSATFFVMALALPLTLAAQTQQTSQNDPFVGTWKLDTAKSKCDPGPCPTSETVTIQPDSVSVQETAGNGSTTSWSYAQTWDTNVPITGMQDSNVTSHKDSDRVVEHTWKMGNAHYKGRGVVSKNDKTMRYTLNGTDQNGKPVHNVLVFEKQS